MHSLIREFGSVKIKCTDLIFGKKSISSVEDQLQGSSLRQDYWAIVRRQFKKNRLAVWSLRILCGLLLIALLSNVLANEKPLYCKIEGKTYFPIFQSFAVDLGLKKWDEALVNIEWHEQENFDNVRYTLIPYSYNTLDLKNANYKGPFDKQRVQSAWFHHRLGTDHLGRDIAAGMIAGTRTAVLVGVIAMSIASIIGLFFGAIAGYFGDNRLKVSRIRFWLNILAFVLGLFYAFSARSYAFEVGTFAVELIKSLGILILFFLVANLLASGLKRIKILGQKMVIPADMIIMRLIEILRSMPSLLLILAVVAIIESPSLVYVMVIIGLISWTNIARFIRAELLRIRNQEYIEAAQAMGFSEWHIIIKHAIPNALTPVLITIAFGMAGAILLEAFLSFLGIGMPTDSVTWGSMLNLSRPYPKAWWLAIFPGFAIFLTVTIFNLLGEGLTEAMDPKALKSS